MSSLSFSDRSFFPFLFCILIEPNIIFCPLMNWLTLHLDFSMSGSVSSDSEIALLRSSPDVQLFSFSICAVDGIPDAHAPHCHLRSLCISKVRDMVCGMESTRSRNSSGKLSWFCLISDTWRFPSSQSRLLNQEFLAQSTNPNKANAERPLLRKRVKLYSNRAAHFRNALIFIIYIRISLELFEFTFIYNSLTTHHNVNVYILIITTPLQICRLGR